MTHISHRAHDRVLQLEHLLKLRVGSRVRRFGSHRDIPVDRSLMMGSSFLLVFFAATYAIISPCDQMSTVLVSLAMEIHSLFLL